MFCLALTTTNIWLQQINTHNVYVNPRVQCGVTYFTQHSQHIPRLIYHRPSFPPHVPHSVLLWPKPSNWFLTITCQKFTQPCLVMLIAVGLLGNSPCQGGTSAIFSLLFWSPSLQRVLVHRRGSLMLSVKSRVGLIGYCVTDGTVRP